MSGELDPSDPKVVSWRLSELEKKVDSLASKMEASNSAVTSKIDSLSLLVTKNLCPSPGACIQIIEGMRELKTIVEKHEEAIQEFKLKAAQATASFKTVIAIAGGGGSIVGAIAALLVQILTK